MAKMAKKTAGGSGEVNPRQRMIYVKIRMAEIREELANLAEERKALQLKLKDQKPAGGSDAD